MYNSYANICIIVAPLILKKYKNLSMKNNIELNTLLARYIQEQDNDKFIPSDNQYQCDNHQYQSDGLQYQSDYSSDNYDYADYYASIHKSKAYSSDNKRIVEESDQDFYDYSNNYTQNNQNISQMQLDVQNQEVKQYKRKQKYGYARKYDSDESFQDKCQDNEKQSHSQRSLLLSKYGITTKSNHIQQKTNRKNILTPDNKAKKIIKKRKNKQNSKFNGFINPLISKQHMICNFQKLQKQVTEARISTSAKDVDRLFSQMGIKNSKALGSTTTRQELQNWQQFLKNGTFPQKYYQKFCSLLK